MLDISVTSVTFIKSANQCSIKLCQICTITFFFFVAEDHSPCDNSNIKINYRSYSVKGAPFFSRNSQFLLKITAKVWVRLIGEYFPETIFFFNHSYWYDFKQIKGHTVLFIDFYKYGGSEKNRLGCVLPGVYSSSLSLLVSNSLSSLSSTSRTSSLSLSSS